MVIRLVMAGADPDVLPFLQGERSSTASAGMPTSRVTQLCTGGLSVASRLSASVYFDMGDCEPTCPPTTPLP